MSLGADLPVARSPRAGYTFLATAIITVAALFWSHQLLMRGDSHGLSPIFFALFTVFDYPAATCALIVLVAAVLVPARVSFRPLLRWIGERPLQLSTAAALVLCAGAVGIYRSHPLAMDEYAQVFQSRVFAAGHLSGQLPPPLLDWLIPHGFQNYFLNVSTATGHVASAYWPSFALLLTPFTFLGIPWACNPVLSALTLIVVHRLALRLFADVESAGLALLLTAASPVFFANGISFYSMPAHLLANSLYALLLVTPTRRSALLAGLVGSVALTLHNPVPHMLFAVPWVIWVATRAGGPKLLLALSAGYLPLSLILGVGWFWFSGHLVHEGIAAAAVPAAAVDLKHVARAFAIPDATVLFARLVGVAKIWLWAVPGLPLFAAIGLWKWRKAPLCQALAASAGLTFVGYLFVTADQGHGWGFRYFHSAWVALPVLAAGALSARRTDANQAAEAHEDFLRTPLVACALLSLILGNGLRAQQIHEFIADDLSQLAPYAGTEPRVEFIAAGGTFYGADLVQNDPWMRGNAVRMLSRGPEADAAIIRSHFPRFHLVFAGDHGTVWSTAQPGKTGPTVLQVR